MFLKIVLLKRNFLNHIFVFITQLVIVASPVHPQRRITVTLACVLAGESMTSVMEGTSKTKTKKFRVKHPKRKLFR